MFFDTVIVDSAVCVLKNVFRMVLVVIVVLYGRLRLKSHFKFIHIYIYIYIIVTLRVHIQSYFRERCTNLTKI
jgi:hypothetical protein